MHCSARRAARRTRRRRSTAVSQQRRARGRSARQRRYRNSADWPRGRFGTLWRARKARRQRRRHARRASRRCGTSRHFPLHVCLIGPLSSRNPIAVLLIDSLLFHSRASHLHRHQLAFEAYQTALRIALSPEPPSAAELAAEALADDGRDDDTSAKRRASQARRKRKRAQRNGVVPVLGGCHPLRLQVRGKASECQ